MRAFPGDRRSSNALPEQISQLECWLVYLVSSCASPHQWQPNGTTELGDKFANDLPSMDVIHEKALVQSKFPKAPL